MHLIFFEIKDRILKIQKLKRETWFEMVGKIQNIDEKVIICTEKINIYDQKNSYFYI